MGRVKKYLSDNIDRERKEITTVNTPCPYLYCTILNLTLAEPSSDNKLQIRNHG